MKRENINISAKTKTFSIFFTGQIKKKFEGQNIYTATKKKCDFVSPIVIVTNIDFQIIYTISKRIQSCLIDDR